MHCIIKSLLLILIISASARGLVGGIDSNIKQFPYLAAIKYHGLVRCAGTIISPDKILTAATCVHPYKTTSKNGKIRGINETMRIITGMNQISKSGNVHEVKDIQIHDDFDIKKRTNDIAIITLESKINYTELEQPISLPDKNFVANTTAVTAGWGTTDYAKSDKPNDILQSMNETVISIRDCLKLFKTPIEITSDNFCAMPVIKGSNQCFGDTGNPLVQNGKVIGIYAWGIGISCDGQYPDGYTNVFKFLDFIKNHM